MLLHPHTLRPGSSILSYGLFHEGPPLARHVTAREFLRELVLIGATCTCIIITEYDVQLYYARSAGAGEGQSICAQAGRLLSIR